MPSFFFLNTILQTFIHLKLGTVQFKFNFTILRGKFIQTEIFLRCLQLRQDGPNNDTSDEPERASLSSSSAYCARV